MGHQLPSLLAQLRGPARRGAACPPPHVREAAVHGGTVRRSSSSTRLGTHCRCTGSEHVKAVNQEPVHCSVGGGSCLLSIECVPTPNLGYWPFAWIPSYSHWSKRKQEGRIPDPAATTTQGTYLLQPRIPVA